MYTHKPSSIEQQALSEIASLFAAAGWQVENGPKINLSPAGHQVALQATKGDQRFIVEIKTASEGRPDRVIALLSQAILQVKACAHNIQNAHPLALVWVGSATPALLRRIEDFCLAFAPDVSIGLISGDGTRFFLGPELDGLNVPIPPMRNDLLHQHKQTYNLFSDLNQWMLKVLLAPEIPESLLVAPRGSYRNASELAAAANVSVMSAFRFITSLRAEDFLAESEQYIRLVRRRELFQRWQSAVRSPSPEVRMRFLIPGNGQIQLRKFVLGHQACLGLFAAADALGLGHVSGVPPYVYVPKISSSGSRGWKELTLASTGEQPNLIVKQAPATQSLFRGAVTENGIRVADVLQVWLDVFSHPSRGAEQADLLYRKVLHDVIGDIR